MVEVLGLPVIEGHQTADKRHDLKINVSIAMKSLKKVMKLTKRKRTCTIPLSTRKTRTLSFLETKTTSLVLNTDTRLSTPILNKIKPQRRKSSPFCSRSSRRWSSRRREQAWVDDNRTKTLEQVEQEDISREESCVSA